MSSSISDADVTPTDKRAPPAPDPRPGRNPGYAEPKPRDRDDAKHPPPKHPDRSDSDHEQAPSGNP
jgi:hypothetical protein